MAVLGRQVERRLAVAVPRLQVHRALQARKELNVGAGSDLFGTFDAFTPYFVEANTNSTAKQSLRDSPINICGLHLWCPTTPGAQIERTQKSKD